MFAVTSEISTWELRKEESQNVSNLHNTKRRTIEKKSNMLSSKCATNADWGRFFLAVNASFWDEPNRNQSFLVRTVVMCIPSCPQTDSHIGSSHPKSSSTQNRSTVSAPPCWSSCGSSFCTGRGTKRFQKYQPLLEKLTRTNHGGKYRRNLMFRFFHSDFYNLQFWRKIDWNVIKNQDKNCFAKTIHLKVKCKGLLRH